MKTPLKHLPALAAAAILVVLLGAAEPVEDVIAHFDFEETDETQTAVKDSAGPPFSHGTLMGKDGSKPEFIAFRKGKALRFQSGKGQYVVVEAEEALKGAFENGLTISATIRFDKIPLEKQQVFTIFSRYDYPTNNRSFSLAVRNRKEDRIIVEWSISGDGKEVIAMYTPPGLKMDTVYEVTAIFDPAGRIETYVDGKLSAKKDVDVQKLHSGPAPVAIGCRYARDNPVNHFNGVVDDLKVFGGIVRPSSKGASEKPKE